MPCQHDTSSGYVASATINYPNPFASPDQCFCVLYPPHDHHWSTTNQAVDVSYTDGKLTTAWLRLDSVTPAGIKFSYRTTGLESRVTFYTDSGLEYTKTLLPERRVIVTPTQSDALRLRCDPHSFYDPQSDAAAGNNNPTVSDGSQSSEKRGGQNDKLFGHLPIWSVILGACIIVVILVCCFCCCYWYCYRRRRNSDKYKQNVEF